MLELKISTEMLTDIFTPGVFGVQECVEGLPKGVTLVDVSFDIITETVTYLFDDGKPEINPMTVTYTSRTMEQVT